MYSGILMAFSSLVFGFSVNFYMAIVFRYLTGLTNGKNLFALIVAGWRQLLEASSTVTNNIPLRSEMPCISVGNNFFLQYFSKFIDEAVCDTHTHTMINITIKAAMLF